MSQHFKQLIIFSACGNTYYRYLKNNNLWFNSIIRVLPLTTQLRSVRSAYYFILFLSTWSKTFHGQGLPGTILSSCPLLIKALFRTQVNPLRSKDVKTAICDVNENWFSFKRRQIKMLQDTGDFKSTNFETWSTSTRRIFILILWGSGRLFRGLGIKN